MPKKTLTTLRDFDMKRAHVTLSIVARSLVARAAKYGILRVEVDGSLKTKLASILATASGGVTKIREYEYATEDQDDDSLRLPISETDFAVLRGALVAGTEIARAQRYEDLLGAWGYVIRASSETADLYGFRLVSKNWSTRKLYSIANAIFKDQVLVDLDQRAVFRIDEHLDFLCLNDEVIILDKRNFETAMNFRAGMEKNRDEVIQEFKQLGLFQDTAALGLVIGDNISLLRRISMVQKSGYYKNPGYIAKLHALLAKKKKWGVMVQDGRMILTEENAEVVLTLLNNARLESMINQEVFDVPVKKKVE